MINAIIRTLINILVIKYGFTLFTKLDIDAINSGIGLVILLYFLVVINNENILNFENRSKSKKLN